MVLRFFPSSETGMPDKIKALMEHNMQKVEEVAPKSGLHLPFLLPHLETRLPVARGRALPFEPDAAPDDPDKKIPLKEMNVTVTYHDPCDLAKQRVFEEPRQVTQAIPGLKLVEMAYNRQLSMCCGGGGNVRW